MTVDRLENLRKKTGCQRSTRCGLKDGGKVKLIQRNKVCAMEIMKEMLCLSDAAIDTQRGKAVNSILQRIGWTRMGTPRKFGPYGSQKGFYRPC